MFTTLTKYFNSVDSAYFVLGEKCQMKDKTLSI